MLHCTLTQEGGVAKIFKLNDPVRGNVTRVWQGGTKGAEEVYCDGYEWFIGGIKEVDLTCNSFIG